MNSTQERNILLNWIDSQFSGSISSGLVYDFPVTTVQPADLQIILMWENIGEVKVTGYPINCNSSNTIRTNSFFNDRLDFGTVGSYAENTVPVAPVELDPIDPILSEVNVHM